jgi:hypothetical protein
VALSGSNQKLSTAISVTAGSISATVIAPVPRVAKARGTE